MMKRLFTVAMLGLALLVAPSARPEPAKGKADAKSSPEEDALQKRAEAFVEAFNKGDAKAMSGFWTAEGDMVDQEGHHFKGRKAIQELYEKFFAETKGAKLYIRVGSTRVAKPELALEDGETEVVFADGGPPSAGRYTIVWVKDEGKWYFESVREAVATPPNNTDRLKDLAFLIGDWVEDTKEGGTSKASYMWDVEQNFIINTFEVAMKDVSIAGGTQWIGWDASIKKPRAWSFIFNGGFAEGVYTKDGENKWKVGITATSRDGSKITATNLVKKTDADHFSMQFIDRKQDGKELPDTKELKMKRAQ